MSSPDIVHAEGNAMSSKNHPNHLQIYRNRMRLSCKQVAHLLGHSMTSSLTRFELGRSVPSLRTALRLAAIYRVPVEFLFPRLYLNEREEIRKLEEQVSRKWQLLHKKSLTSNIHVLA
jgi:DNA-binding XRE family transcriptional regulator